jgi:protein-L-isoaspartate O-methyltransferase
MKKSVLFESFTFCKHNSFFLKTISAMALDLLEEHLKPGNKVLDVGVGSGYLVGCMAQMVGDTGSVLGIDVVEPLVTLAEQNLRRIFVVRCLKYDLKLFFYL